MSFENVAVLYIGAVFLALAVMLQWIAPPARKKLRWVAFPWMQQALRECCKQHRKASMLRLTARVLLIAGISFFIAHPVFSYKQTTTKLKKSLVLVDNTLSMSMPGNDPHIVYAKQIAMQAPEDAIIYSFDGQLRKIGESNDGVENRNERIAQIKPSIGAGKLHSALEQIRMLPEYVKVDSILFISDLQSDAFEIPSLHKACTTIKNDGKKIALMPVARTYVQNVAILTTRVISGAMYPGDYALLEVDLQNRGSSDSQKIIVTIMVDGSPEAHKSVDLEIGQKKTVRMRVKLQNPGYQYISIVIPDDGFAPDNKFTGVLNVPDRWSVLSVNGSKRAGLSLDFFFEKALKSSMSDNALSYTHASSKADAVASHHDLYVAFLKGPRDVEVFDLAKEQFEKGKGVLLFCHACSPHWDAPAVSIRPGSEDQVAMPVADKPVDGAMSFMHEKKFDIEAIHFYRFSTIASEYGTPTLFARNADDPLMVRFTGRKSNMLIAGFLPCMGYTDFVYNPNFVQFVMNCCRDAIGQSTNVSFALEAGSSFVLADLMPYAEISLQTEKEGILPVRREADRLLAPPFATNDYGCITEDGVEKEYVGLNMTRRDSCATFFYASDDAGNDLPGVKWIKQFDTAHVSRSQTLAGIWPVAVLVLVLVSIEFWVAFLKRTKS